jgi:murein L,D-transpeptidase YcbB/YkuD
LLRAIVLRAIVLRAIVLLAIVLLVAGPAAQAADEAVIAAARRIVAEGTHPWLAQPRMGRHRAAMEALYARGTEAPHWVAASTPRDAPGTVLDMLATAAEKGLDPRDYEAGTLAERHAALLRQAATAEDAAAVDVGLSLAFVRYLSDIHLGRIDPRAAGFDIDVAPKRIDLAPVVRQAAATGRIREAVSAAEPGFPMYGRLLEALASYRALAAQPPVAPVTGIRDKLSSGDACACLAELAARLVAFGDLSPDRRPGVESRYAGAIVDAVVAFQERHGLEPDGVVGRATLGALNRPIDSRVRQIELALERVRWLPELPRSRAIAVNIPEFKLWAFDPDRHGTGPAFRMDVIVGKAVPTHRTPIFAERMTYLEFSPYWNVPPGILRRETLPRLARDPGYLAREQMELVHGDGRVSTALDGAALEALARGEARLRQRPGPDNAVGGVKFVFPNHANVYLHDTPTRELFKRTRRDFSHGCIRVADPVKLAQFVLGDASGWSEEDIRAAMTAGTPRFVPLDRAVPVLIFYVTSLVDPKGRVLFLPDPYGHDATLDRALSRRRFD